MKKSLPKVAVLAVAAFLSLGIFLTYSLADNAPVSGSYGISQATGVFYTGGNAGAISFEETPPAYSGAQIYKSGDNVYLTGIFWMQTVGWASFSESPMQLMPPPTGANVRDPWYLSGLAWSPNAGWISFNHGEPYASGVVFIPDTAYLMGNAWSDALGWIPFGDMTSSGVKIGTNDGFIGKVSVSGQIGGSKTFNVLYDVGGAFSASSMTSFINTVRKNVTLLIRNAGGKINTNLTAAGQSINKAMIFKLDANPSADFLTYSDQKITFDNDMSRSLIVIGADLYIDVDAPTPVGMNQNRAFIALKNENGQGGNIYIKGDVKKIEGILFSEGSIISGLDTGLGLSPYYVKKENLFTDMPPNQLYIKGSIIGNNTIGGSSKDGGAVCPYIEGGFTCTYDTAAKYDWNYFRIFRSGDAPRRANPADASYDAYSVIIDYDERTLQDPPPGLETLN